MKIIKESSILDVLTVCPYCMSENSADNWRGCCGESSAHFETAYNVEGEDELLLDSEIQIKRGE